MVLLPIEKCGFVVWQFRLGMTVDLLIAGIFTEKVIYVVHSLSTLTSVRRNSPCNGCSNTQDGPGKLSRKAHSLSCGWKEGNSSKLNTESYKMKYETDSYIVLPRTVHLRKAKPTLCYVEQTERG